MTYRVKARIPAGWERAIAIPTKRVGGPNIKTLMILKHEHDNNPYLAFGICQFRRYSAHRATYEAARQGRIFAKYTRGYLARQKYWQQRFARLTA
jgi:hypothetical protein